MSNNSNKTIKLAIAGCVLILLICKLAKAENVIFDRSWIGPYPSKIIELFKKSENISLNEKKLKKTNFGLYFSSSYEEDFENEENKYYYGYRVAV